MVPYVRKSFTKHIKDGLIFIEKKSVYKQERFDKWLKSEGKDALAFSDYDIFGTYHPEVWEYALRKTEQEIHQAVEGMYHNLNTLQSRSGN